jgi:hypothetical protein
MPSEIAQRERSLPTAAVMAALWQSAKNAKSEEAKLGEN